MAVWCGGPGSLMFFASWMALLSSSAANHHRVVVLGDIHGDFAFAKLLLKSVDIIDEKDHWIAHNDILIQTGDIVDRGTESLETYAMFREIRKQAEAAGGKVVQLIGNHEAMNLCALFNYVHPQEIEKTGGYLEWWKLWRADGIVGADVRENFEISFQFEGILFVHAGLGPWLATLSDHELRERFHEQITPICPQAGMEVETPDIVGTDGPLWTRRLSPTWGESTEEIACELVEETLEIREADIMVVGHTPTASGLVEIQCDGKLVVVDTAISRYYRGTPAVLIIEDGHLSQLAFIPREIDPAVPGRRRYEKVVESLGVVKSGPIEPPPPPRLNDEL